MSKIKKANAVLGRGKGIDSIPAGGIEPSDGENRVAQLIYEVRKSAGMSQQRLAEAVGTTQSVISQLEDADYEGHSLSTLRRIAKVLNRRVEISMPELTTPR